MTSQVVQTAWPYRAYTCVLGSERVKTVEQVQRNKEKLKRAMEGKIGEDKRELHFGKLEKRQPAFFKFISICMKVVLMMLGSHLGHYVAVILSITDIVLPILSWEQINIENKLLD